MGGMGAGGRGVPAPAEATRRRARRAGCRGSHMPTSRAVAVPRSPKCRKCRDDEGIETCSGIELAGHCSTSVEDVLRRRGD